MTSLWIADVLLGSTSRSQPIDALPKSPLVPIFMALRFPLSLITIIALIRDAVGEVVHPGKVSPTNTTTLKYHHRAFHACELYC